MAFSIPSDIRAVYKTAMDAVINDISPICTLIYPPIRIDCPDCTSNLTGGSKNVYQNGGPSPFFSNTCANCGGDGFKEDAQTEDIRLRVYWSRRDWIKVTDGIQAADGDIQVIGFISELPKFRQADKVLIPSNTEGLIRQEYRLSNDPTPHGYSDNKLYFMAFMGRV